MLDTYGRKYTDSLIKSGADVFLKFKFKPNQVTILAFILGICSSVCLYYDKNILSVIVLWISGYFDAVDGEMARKSNQISMWGTLLDITFDRIVEILIIVTLGIKYPQSRLVLIILCGCIILSMTVFLTVGALAEKNGIKSFYYQAGLAERTEGFILFSLMIILHNNLILITGIFAILVFITAVQRMREAKKIFNS